MPILSDTSPKSQELNYQLISKLSPSERIEKMMKLIKSAKDFTKAGIKQRYPNASEEELRIRLLAIFFGRDYCITHHNWDPEVEGY